MMNKKNKAGAEKTLTIYWFAILVIVAGAVIYMISSVYGKPYDVRGIEADIIANNMGDCISEGGYLKDGVVMNSSFKENFLKKCSLNFMAADFPESNGEYYIEINFYDFDSGEKIDFEISEGNINLKQNCGKEGKTLPVCSQKTFYVIDKNQADYRIDITSIVNKAEKNA
jgi:hypothetical protein